MEIIKYLNEHPLFGVAIIFSVFLGFIFGAMVIAKFYWANIGTFTSFFKERKCYILKNVIGYHENEKIYVFQKVKINGHSVVYSRKFYIQKDSNFDFWGKENFTENVIFKVDKIEKGMNNKISSLTISLVEIKISSNAPKQNLVQS